MIVRHVDAEDSVSLFMAAAAIIVIAIGVFLPIWDAGSVATFTSIKGNSLIQSGNGWVALGAIAWSAFSIARTFQGHPLCAASLLVGSAIVIGYVIYVATSDELMTLCPLGSTGTSAPGCERASAGIGLYAIGLGGALEAIAGGLLWGHQRGRRSGERRSPFARVDIGPVMVRGMTAERVLAMLEPGVRAAGPEYEIHSSSEGTVDVIWKAATLRRAATTFRSSDVDGGVVISVFGEASLELERLCKQFLEDAEPTKTESSQHPA